LALQNDGAIGGAALLLKNGLIPAQAITSGAMAEDG
jgi:hypothetical protein